LRQRNLLSIRLNYIYGSFQIYFVIFDQVKNILLEANFPNLGPEKTFFYWLLAFCIEDFLMRFVFNSIILVHAHRRLPEFAGYKGRRYPGDQGPREAQILPRRLDLPQDFHEDWRKIGSKRNKMVIFDQPETIYVKPVKPE